MYKLIIREQPENFRFRDVIELRERFDQIVDDFTGMFIHLGSVDTARLGKDGEALVINENYAPPKAKPSSQGDK